MKCKVCGNADSKVLESRNSDDFSIRRRRECLECGWRFTTYETLSTPELIVLKKNGKRENFDKQKILNGLLRACQKRNVSLESLEEIASGIESKLIESGKKEVEVFQIGEEILKKLKEIDDVAYIRFASVYKKFDDKNDFLSVLESL